MGLLVYNIAITLYSIGISIASWFNSKAKHLSKGRRNWRKTLASIDFAGSKWIWIHCASLGEFEQGRPFIEEIRSKYPAYRILLSFFSPSGYNVRKNYEHADAVIYMPADTRSNAETLVSTVRPSLAVFVKYEFWYHHLNSLQVRGITTVLISAAFRQDQIFFKWYGGIFRKMLPWFHTIFVQDEASCGLLRQIGVESNVIVAGDTRYDRVATIASNARKIPEVERFLAGAKAIIAGSTWPGDEALLKNIAIPAGWKLIIAPHEIDPQHLAAIRSLFGADVIFFSEMVSGISDHSILVIDNIGMLSSLYAYGQIAYVGGGFQKGGIHNVLEPAVFGLPVVFGPVHEKFVEANELKELGFAFAVDNSASITAVISGLMNDDDRRLRIRQSLIDHMRLKTGATSIVVAHLVEEKKL